MIIIGLGFDLCAHKIFEFVVVRCINPPQIINEDISD